MTSKNSSETVLIVVIDDEPQNLRLMEAALGSEAGLRIMTATDPEQGLELIQQQRPQVVLVDLMMPKVSGMEVLERVSVGRPETEVILMTAHYSTRSAVEAIRKGASDYLEKPISLERLRSSVICAVEAARLRMRAAQLDEELARACRFEGMIGRSPAIMEVFARVKRVAPHFRTALISGATGTGKELVAQALHRLAPGALGRFAVCNCSAVVETLFESELFGHVKGAFTGATQDKVGLFEYANGGTVFLDEIGELPFTVQAKLLRVVQSQELQRVGAPAVRKIDVRVVAATNRNLRQEVAAKRFREDLYYRLAMVEIPVPRLSERREDLPLLTRHFIAHFAKEYGKEIGGITMRAQALLSRYAWPGNIRELENAIGHACMMLPSDT
ncbi:MAG: sigma-54-dependent transcriptional regulator, partial [Candidatus Acidiferrales bacterium]